MATSNMHHFPILFPPKLTLIEIRSDLWHQYVLSGDRGLDGTWWAKEQATSGGVTSTATKKMTSKTRFRNLLSNTARQNILHLAWQLRTRLLRKLRTGELTPSTRYEVSNFIVQ
jgi:hypothetical protein